MQANKQNHIIEIYCLLAIDCLCAMAAYLLAIFIRYGSFAEAHHKETYVLVSVWVLLFTVLYDSLIGSGRNFVRRGYYVEAKSIGKQVAGMLIFIGCSLFFFKEAENFSRPVFGFFIILDGILMFISHGLLKKYLRAHYKTDRASTKVMVITDTQNVESLVHLLLEKMDYTCELSSAAIWDENRVGSYVQNVPVSADGNNIIDVIKTMAVDEVFIHLPELGKSALEKLIMDMEAMGIICHYNIDALDLNAKMRSIEEFAGFTVVTYAVKQMDYRRGMIKRLMDICGSLVGLLITGLLFPFVALAIKLESKGPVVFSQVRIGKNGRRFKIYKFRSMYLDAEERKKELEAKNEMQGLMFKMEDDPRVTKVGKFIRKTSIDELPQFYNVLKGDMSLVGTRPPTEDEFSKYTPYYRRRLCMTPGLTGLWQVSGRSNVDNFDDVVKYDLHYIDYWSLSLDIKILAQTVLVVLFGKGAK